MWPTRRTRKRGPEETRNAKMDANEAETETETETEAEAETDINCIMGKLIVFTGMLIVVGGVERGVGRGTTTLMSKSPSPK